MKNPLDLAKRCLDITNNKDTSLLQGLDWAIKAATAQAICKGRHRLIKFSPHKLSPREADIRQRFPDWMESETGICLRCFQEDPAMEEICKHEKKNVEWTEPELERLYLY